MNYIKKAILILISILLLVTIGYAGTTKHTCPECGFTGLMDPVPPPQTEFTNKWVEGQFITYSGQSLCKYIDYLVQEKVRKIALEMAEKFPDAKDKVLRVGDANGMISFCPKHDNNHRGRSNFDLNYFTTIAFDQDKKTWGNNTHYAKKGEGFTNIWLSQSIFFMKVNKTVFDWRRTFYFLEAMVREFPDVRFGIQEKLCDYMIYMVGFQKFQPLIKHITRAPGKAMNHHMHMHVYTKYQY